MPNIVGSLRDLLQSDLPDGDVSEDKEMTILEHLEELRERIIKIALALLITTAFAFIFTPRILEILKGPAPAGTNLIFIEVTEMFVTYFKVALLSGVGLAMPVIVYQIIRFVGPALTRREKRIMVTILPLISIFFFAGVVFGYLVTLPFAVRFMLTFSDVAVAQIRIGNYIGFVTTILFWMGISFQLPVVMHLLARLGMVDSRRLMSYRKYAILLIFIFAAFITPPDPLSQIMVALPMIVLYEVGILMARLGRQHEG